MTMLPSTHKAALQLVADQERELAELRAKLARVRAETIEEAARAVCGYVGRCNSNRCPCHAVRALGAS